MLSICLCVMLMTGFGWWIEVHVRTTEARRRALRLDDVAKELASWDRTKELGFDDVLLWEAAFEKATGALPEGSKTKELEIRYMQLQQPHENAFDHERRMGLLSGQIGLATLGAPIRMGNYYLGNTIMARNFVR